MRVTSAVKGTTKSSALTVAVPTFLAVLKSALLPVKNTLAPVTLALVPAVVKSIFCARRAGSVLAVVSLRRMMGWSVSPAATVVVVGWSAVTPLSVMACGVNCDTVASKPFLKPVPVELVRVTVSAPSAAIERIMPDFSIR